MAKLVDRADTFIWVAARWTFGLSKDVLPGLETVVKVCLRFFSLRESESMIYAHFDFFFLWRKIHFDFSGLQNSADWVPAVYCSVLQLCSCWPRRNIQPKYLLEHSVQRYSQLIPRSLPHFWDRQWQTTRSGCRPPLLLVQFSLLSCFLNLHLLASVPAASVAFTLPTARTFDLT